MLDMVGRSLGTLCIFLVMPFVSSGHGVVFEAGTQDAATSSAGQLPSSQTVIASTTEAVRTGHSRAPGPDLKVKWEAGKLSLDAAGVPLSEVLQAVSHETGIEVVGSRGLSDRLFIHLAGMDLVQALKELLSGVDYVIAAGPPGSASAHTTRVVIISRVAAATTTPEGAQEESQSPVTEAAVDAAPGPAQQESQPVVAEAAATAAPDAYHEESEPPVDEVAQQESQLAAIEAAAASGDLETLRNGLLDVDPAVQATAFQSLAEENPATAVDDLLASIQDGSQPTRLQSLQLLVQSGAADDQAVMSVLGDALKDPDPAFVAYAVQALAGLGNAAAMDALSDAFQGADQSTKLMIINSVANTEAGLPLLSEALSDPDAAVSDAAATVLK
jgi:hypothetical protein